VLLVAAGLAACSSSEGAGRPDTPASRPNVVLIVADDERADGLDHMPQTTELFGDEGTAFTQAVSSYPNCCPSRTTMMTGQYAHNHGVLDNLPPYGAAAFEPDRSLPVALQDAGYRTSHIGKWLNGYGETVPPEPLPGWDDWYTFVDPSTYDPYDFRISTNDGIVEPSDRPRAHTTDVTRDEAISEVEHLSAADDPYYLQVDFVAPHSMTGSSTAGAPVPQPEHATTEVDVSLDLEAMAESDLTDKPGHVGVLAQPDRAGVEATLAPLAVATARSLLGLDEAVAAIAEAVDATGEDTLLVFTSDNGLFLGEHGLFGKLMAYEPSIRIPLLVRGAGFPEGTTVDAPVANIDLAPTIAALADAEPLVDQDGRSLYPLAQDPPDADADPRAILLEDGPTSASMPHYAAVRVDGWLYVEWETGELELYDLEADPSQLESLHVSAEHAAVREQLAAALDRLRACAGEACDVYLSVPRP
jgi:arylsulfatase A-like enzyme